MKIKIMKKKLKSILVCPLCKGPLIAKKRHFYSSLDELICEKDKLAYPVRKGVPILLQSDARVIDIP